MKLIINGQKTTFAAPLNIADCLDQQGFGDKLVAVARNGSFVPRERHSETTLEDGDEIEIVAPMQGG